MFAEWQVPQPAKQPCAPPIPQHWPKCLKAFAAQRQVSPALVSGQNFYPQQPARFQNVTNVAPQFRPACNPTPYATPSPTPRANNCPTPARVIIAEVSPGLQKSPTPTNVDAENKKLKRDLKALKQDFETLKKLMENSSLLSKDEASGLIRGRGRPPKGDKHLKIREARARALIKASDLLQGREGPTGEDLFVRNVEDFLDVAIEEDPKVLHAMARALSRQGPKEWVPDGRFKTGFKELKESCLMRRNAFLMQASGYMQNSDIDRIREFGGKRFVDTPQQLQKWCVSQPEMPLIQFVAKGSSTAVFTPLDSLLRDKLMKQQRIRSCIRSCAPFKPGKVFVWFMVYSPLPARGYHTTRARVCTRLIYTSLHVHNLLARLLFNYFRIIKYSYAFNTSFTYPFIILSGRRHQRARQEW